MWQVIINGPGYFDTAYDLPEGTTYLGRADNNDIVLSGDQVSRRHAKIEVRARDLVIEDMGSRNGTEVNGSKIDGPQQVGLGDILGIGENTLALREPAAAESAKTDPIDLTQLAASGLQGVDITGEILVAHAPDQNPFLTHYGRVGQYDARSFSTGAMTMEKSLEEFESLFLLIKVSEKLNTSTSLKQFLEDVIALVVDVAQARTGVALLRDERGKLKPLVVRHTEELASGEVPVSDSILAEVARKKVALAVMDAKGDKRFAARESVLLYDLDQVICVPMVKGDDLLGVIYLNRKTEHSMPLTRLMDVVSAIAHMAANGVDSWRLRERAQSEETMRKALERFHAPAIVERVMSDLRSPSKAVAHMESKEVTVMFADISGFTPLTERLPAERVVDLLSEYYSRMTQVVFSFDGTVDKFIGDAVMAVFGAPYARPDDATRAVRCAMACRREFVEMMRKRPDSERCGLKIGLNTGKVLAGTLGSEARIEYTCLGDAVNIAARLQSSASPGQVLITGKTLAATGARFDVAPLGERELKGKKQKVAVFEVLEEDSEMHTMPGV
jgi:class 3 adenylate cyclase/pSer/pThr/pTyr-binding forkhead associated (FHA) protein/putative methionine-R-sulfoxide reductase with GAF domain